MRTVDLKSKDMPMPSEAYLNRHDGRVFILLSGEDGKTHKKTIGYLTDRTEGQERMIPNQYFKEYFPNLWSEAYPDEKIPFHEMSIGLYSLTWGICDRNGLYSILRDVYGPLYANSVLDYCMFTIKHRSDVPLGYKNVMEGEVLFADRCYSDSWYSEFFQKKMSEDLNHFFKINWVKSLGAKGLRKVWLGMDGSNYDCEIRQSLLAKHGFPEVHNIKARTAGYMYAVDAGSGMPVTYFVYEGNVPDRQTFQKMATFLEGFNVEIEGIILDPGFAVEPVFEEIEKHGWGYVVMLPSDSNGYSEMVRDHGEEIRWKSARLIKDETIFGTSDVKQLFGIRNRESHLCLFFDGGSGSNRSKKLIEQIQEAQTKAEEAIAKGSQASIKQKFQKYLHIEGEGANRKVVPDYEKWDADMEGQGYFCMAVSDGIDPSRAFRLYQMRDDLETQYSILRTQEGGHNSRVHLTKGIYSKYAVSFIAGILRHEIQSTCKGLRLDTDLMIQGLDSITLRNTAEYTYESVRNMNADQEKLLGHFGISKDDVVLLGKEFNDRNRTAAKNPVRKISGEPPIIQKNTRKVGRPSTRKESKLETKDTTVQPETPKSKGGRPKGKADSKPRKPRSDKGKKRGPRAKKE